MKSAAESARQDTIMTMGTQAGFRRRQQHGWAPMRTPSRGEGVMIGGMAAMESNEA